MGGGMGGGRGSSRAEVRAEGEGAGKGVVYAYEAYDAKKKRGKMLRNSHRRIFLFKKKSVMKCLRSKKRLNGPVTTYIHRYIDT